MFLSLLKKNSIKQVDVAKSLNYSKQLVCKWVKGKCEPSLNAVIKMSEVFHIPIEEILLSFKKEDSSQEQTQLDSPVMFDYIDD